MIPIKFNGESLDPQDLYLKIAKGFYFGRELQAWSELVELLSVPLMGPILLNCFYNYTMTGFELTSALYDMFLEVRKSASFQEHHCDKEVRTGGCIYCGSSERNFSSEEHIIAESLGNDELIFPAGLVCDDCNHELLAPLDDALSKFGPIALLRVYYVPHGKDGKLPKANFQNMKMRKASPTQIEIWAKDKTALLDFQEDHEDDNVSFTLSTSVDTSNLNLIARAYFKIALGIVAFDKGAEFALSERYESARAFIRGEKGFPGPLILRRSGRPHENLTVNWQKRDPGSLFFIDIFGVLVTFNLEVEPRMKSPQIFENLGCMVFDLDKMNHVTCLHR
jgi:hypothetical protein